MKVSKLIEHLQNFDGDDLVTLQVWTEDGQENLYGLAQVIEVEAVDPGNPGRICLSATDGIFVDVGDPSTEDAVGDEVEI